VQIAFPFRIDAGGRTALTDDDQHVRDLIEEVLFTSPGERVNRPTFGTSLLRMVFAGAGPEQAAAAQYLIQASLQEWLGDLVQVEQVQVQPEGAGEGSLVVTIAYLVRRTQQRQVAQFTRGV
jgi:phage baseplate assembly protein W